MASSIISAASSAPPVTGEDDDDDDDNNDDDNDDENDDDVDDDISNDDDVADNISNDDDNISKHDICHTEDDIEVINKAKAYVQRALKFCQDVENIPCLFCGKTHCLCNSCRKPFLACHCSPFHEHLKDLIGLLQRGYQSSSGYVF